VIWLDGHRLSKIRAQAAGEVIGALLADGFSWRKSRRGTSHRRYFHADGRRVTVPFHGANTTFVPKILQSIVEEQAEWTEADLVRLGLVRR
jgi:predicted RNA binding protein YcfA (HicA-like mRNA interferase family)